MYKDKRVLVTGGTGLLGRPLVQQLLAEEANVTVVSMDNWRRCPPGAEFVRGDLRYLPVCLKVCSGMDFVFHLAGVKGSPAMAKERPASFFVPNLMMSLNLMEAARHAGVERYLYCSSVGVYPPAEVLREDDVWEDFPSENDWFAGWAKRMGELQAEAYKIEYNWDAVTIVRPSNVFGPWDNFDPANAMVIPSLIRRAMDGENPFVVWGDGSPERDFIFSADVAQGMMLALEKGIGQTFNLGSGVGVSIREIVKIICNNLEKKPDVVWDRSKPSGDKKRILDVSRIKALGFQLEMPIEEGIKETMNWYRLNKTIVDKRFNIFRRAK